MTSGRRARTPRAVVVGDLLLDVVVGPIGAREGDDVNGRIMFRQGGSAATTARWLARLGLRTTLITSIGRDAVGRALVAHLERGGVRVHAARKSRLIGIGRMGVLLDRSGERAFVADRRAATDLAVVDIKAAWLSHADVFHVPAYSLFGEPLAQATLHAGRLARAADALVSVDLASAAFIAASRVERLRGQVRRLRPDVIFATPAEGEAFAGPGAANELTRICPLVIVKRGRLGATAFVAALGGGPIEVPTTALVVTDATGAGDAFAAGVLAALARAGRPVAALDQRAVISAVRAGHRAARRQLTEPRPELHFGA